ncbi:MAG: RHS repeat domain-containing protein [Microthrixaceae bacterium]
MPVFQGSVLDGTIGTATSTEPVLRWSLSVAGPYRFEIADLGPDGGTTLWESGDLNVPEVRVPGGVLAVDRAYRWSARTRAGETFGPFVFRVDVRRDDVQPVEQAIGVGVARATGEPVLDWRSPTVDALAGPVGFSLRYRPSLPERPGLPAGWQLAATGGPWDRLTANQDGTLTLEGTSGLAVVFERVGDGPSFRAVWGAGQTWPAGQFATLVRNTDGTFTSQDTNGTVTTYSDPTSSGGGTVTTVWRAGRPGIVQTWRSGRLVALTDSITGSGPDDRRVSLHYGGEPGCTSPADSIGLIAAPTGQLCGADLWDGRRVAVHYVDPPGDALGPRPARLVAAAGTGADAQVTDLAYDAAGRLSELRSPLATSAIAAGTRTAGGDVTTSLDYDQSGRVAAVVGPSPLPGAERPTMTFGYRIEDGVSAVSTVSIAGQTTSEMELDPATFQTRRSTDRGGRTTLTTWDRARSAVSEVVQPGGLITRTSFDDLGNPIRRVGPASAASIADESAPATAIGLDRSFFGTEDRDGAPRKGLAVTYWPNDTFSGDPAREEIGPTFGDVVPDEYYFSWTDPPIASTSWSGRLTGVLRVPTVGRYSLRVDSGATLFIDDNPCEPACAVDADPARPLRVRLDVATTSGGASMALSWEGPGVSGTVPTSALAPAIGLQADVRIRDSFRAGERTEALGRTVWADPVAGVVGETWSSTGLTRRSSAEPYRPDEGAFGRITGYTQPSGATRTIEYHPATEPVRNPCSDSSAVQGGLVRASVDPAADGTGNGLRSERINDAGGRVVAARSGSAGWTCTSYDGIGREVVTETRGPTGGAIMTTRTDWAGPSSASQDDPLVRAVTMIDASGSHVSSVTMDLLGRPVASIDISGTLTRTIYDPQFTDQVVATTATPRGGSDSTTAFTYAQDGALTAATVDRQPLYAMTYDDLGRIQSITYGNGAVVRYDYDSNGRPYARTVALPSGSSFGEELTLTPTGRTLAAALRSPTGTARYDYVYDGNARLISAGLDTTLPVRERAWEYGYDGNTNRTRERRVDSVGGVTESSATYDRADRLTSVTDPRLAGEVTYDSDGRTTRIGPLSLTYDPLGNLTTVSHTDGSSVRWGYVGSQRVSRTTTDASGSTQTLAFDASGFVRSDDGALIARVLEAPGGVQIVQRRDASTTWNFSTIGGNHWFSTDANGSNDGSMSLFDPYGNVISQPPANRDGVPQATDTPLVNPLFQSGDTQTLGDIAVQHLGARMYLPAVGRFLQPDPVPGGSSNAYGYTDGDPVNAFDTTGNLPDWGKWTLFGVIVLASIALTAVAAPAAGAAIGSAVAGGAAVSGKAAVAQVATSALVGAIIGGGSDVAIQATFTNGFVDGDLDVSQAAISAGIAGVLSGYQAYRSVSAATKKAATSLAISQVQAQGSGQGGGVSQLEWARSIRSSSQNSIQLLNEELFLGGGNSGFQQVTFVSRSASLESQRQALFGREHVAVNIRRLSDVLN